MIGNFEVPLKREEGKGKQILKKKKKRALPSYRKY